MPLKSDIKTVLQNQPAAKRTRIVDNFASAYGYPVSIPDPANPGTQIPNPQTKTDFAADQIANYIRAVIGGEEYRAAQSAVVLPTPLDVNS